MKALKITLTCILLQSPFLFAQQYLDSSSVSPIEAEQRELTMSPGERMLRNTLSYHPFVLAWKSVTD